MRTAWLLPLLLLAPVVVASPYDASPREGDAAEYRLLTSRGATRVVIEWTNEDVWLPKGDLLALPTLRATFDVEEAPNPREMRMGGSRLGLNPFVDAGVPPPRPHVVSMHWDEIFGTSVAWSAQWLDTTDGDRRWATRTTVGSCAQETWFLHWADFECATNATIVRGSGNGLPGRVVGPDWSLEIVGQRRGSGSLAAAPVSSSLPAPLPLVEWTSSGPARGDLPEHAFAEARRAVLAQDPAAARFFLEHPDARVLYARHTWATTALANGDDAWRERIKGVPCTTARAEHAAGSEWSPAWIAQDGSLFALVQSFGTSPAVHRLVDSTHDSYNTAHAGGAPSRLAPSPQALAEQLALVPAAFGEVASIEIDLHPVSAKASVSRGTCARDALTGRLSYTGGSITYAEGRATSTLRLEAERDGPGLLVLSDAPPPSVGAPPSPAGFSPPTAAVAVAASLALAAVVAGLYSRIGRDDILSHGKRALVYAHVRSHPGASIQDIALATGLPRSTAEHHVRTLAKNGYVLIHDAPHGKAVEAAGSRAGKFQPLLERAHVRDLMRLVAASPGSHQDELAAQLGMRKGHLSQLARDLEAAGLLRRERDGRKLRLHPGEGSSRS